MRPLSIAIRAESLRILCGLLLSLGLFHCTNVYAQSITVSPASSAQTVQDYVENVLVGSCVSVSNVTYTGPASASGQFDGNGTALG